MLLEEFSGMGGFLGFLWEIDGLVEIGDGGEEKGRRGLRVR